MGEKRPSVRTLPSGERVTHHPDGNQVLIPSESAVSNFLDSNEEALQAANDRLTQDRLAAVAAKRQSLDAGTPVPNDKRVV
jgi:hypothetical protein